MGRAGCIWGVLRAVRGGAGLVSFARVLRPAASPLTSLRRPTHHRLDIGGHRWPQNLGDEGQIAAVLDLHGPAQRHS